MDILNLINKEPLNKSTDAKDQIQLFEQNIKIYN